MKRLLIATRNKGKLEELRQILSDLPFALCDLKEFASIQPVSETGETFMENALLKATGYALQTGLLTLADDSGLEVDALGGGPGVMSARYAGDCGTDAERRNKLLAELSHVQARARTAHFVSAIAIADQDGKIINHSTGTCEGRIAPAVRGMAGFGYDPIFIPDGYDETFAELPADVKNQISHRAHALFGAREFLRTLTVSSAAR